MKHVLALALASMVTFACVTTPKPSDIPVEGAQAPSALDKDEGVGQACAPLKAKTVNFETTSGRVSVNAELAATPQARRKGLMGRTVLNAGDGMLFVFDREEVQSFWMMNTPISLDMIFMAGQPTGAEVRVVGVVHNAVPHSTDLRSVPDASRFVLEVPGGWSTTHGITAGVRADFCP